MFVTYLQIVQKKISLGINKNTYLNIYIHVLIKCVYIYTYTDMYTYIEHK